MTFLKLTKKLKKNKPNEQPLHSFVGAFLMKGMKLYMFIGKELKRRREALKMSQQQIGEQLGVSQNTVSRIELGLNDRLTLHIAYNGLLNELERRLNNGTKEE